MDLQKLVDDYIRAWNELDLAALLSFFHKDAALYDAFWMELCSGEDLAGYLDTVLKEEVRWYQQAGDLIPTANGLILRYHVHEHTGDGPGTFMFNGADIMTLSDGKIESLSDFYCDSSREALEEVANWTTRHHGRLRNLPLGMPAVKAAQYRDRLAELMEREQAFLNPNLTASEAADRIGCSVGQLNQIVNAELGAHFYSFVDRHRANYARLLLLNASDDPGYVHDVAFKAGFRTFESFSRSFLRYFQVSPQEFHRRNAT